MLVDYQFTWIKDATPVDLSNDRIEVIITNYNCTAYLFKLCWIHYIMLYIIPVQVTTNYSTSSLTIKATDTNATLDNGVYSCQVTLTISGVDSFNKTSSNSTVIFKGMPTAKQRT